ncbi:hypothetical protein M514_10429 [Trichuris suis]|uniref:Uncharacterized protein n=1 Tax=Trichuris suis TaxID=68888 RepID=A0A085LUS2_9BILA|nr:hypothetical protein M513_10429 [Trichuris suis]KFD69308.1 hypothetical protein M514_10429 [Trichuris suis]
MGDPTPHPFNGRIMGSSSDGLFISNPIAKQSLNLPTKIGSVRKLIYVCISTFDTSKSHWLQTATLRSTSKVAYKKVTVTNIVFVEYASLFISCSTRSTFTVWKEVTCVRFYCIITLAACTVESNYKSNRVFATGFLTSLSMAILVSPPVRPS